MKINFCMETNQIIMIVNLQIFKVKTCLKIKKTYIIRVTRNINNKIINK